MRRACINGLFLMWQLASAGRWVPQAWHNGTVSQEHGRSYLQSRLLVVYVAGRDRVSQTRVRGVRHTWSGMQVETQTWSLGCLVVFGGLRSIRGGRNSSYRSDATCPELTLAIPDSYRDLGHKVKGMIRWVAANLVSFDFLLKADVDTLICFSMVTDMIDAMRLRFSSDQRIYLGHIETCSRVNHIPGDRFYDPHYMQDVLFREDASCYPPYMQGLGYVLSRDLVELLGSIADTLKVYTNEDMMVGTWLIGHRVNRGRLVARQFTEPGYQTTLAECFPFYYNHKVPAYVMAECARFHSVTGLCWQPVHRQRGANTSSSHHMSKLGQPRSPVEPSQGTIGSALNVHHATTVSKVPSSMAAGASNGILELVTVGIKVVTHLRNFVHFILHSIHRHFPGIRIIVADDEYVGVAREEWRRLTDLMNDFNVTYVQLIPRVGLSAGRNAIAEACRTKYLVLLDDDVFFTAATRLDLLLEILETRPDIQLAAGAYTQYNSTRRTADVNDYSLLFNAGTETGVWHTSLPVPPRPGECQTVHAAHNFFMARTAMLRQYPWHPKMSIFEHEHFFFQLHQAQQKLVACPHISVFHYRAPNLIDRHYTANSLRFKEHLFARHFCTTFTQVKKFHAPFWTYDCQLLVLCPKWDSSLPCVPMEDPWKLVKRHEERPPQVPNNVLILSEGGAGVELLTQLFARSDHYMVWREPRHWRFTAHMPDNLYTAMLAGLYRCELSAQQLEMLHSQSPDLDPEMNDETGTDQGSEKDESSIQKRYSVKGLNSSDARFCGPLMATASMVDRLHSGLPSALQQLPRTKIVLLVRNPVDVVVARVQAKWVRGGPAWPECTLRTVQQCAHQLCGSVLRMLRTLRLGGENLRLLRWETFARRRQRVASDLLSWLGATANQSAIAQLIAESEGQMRNIKALSDKFPLSPRSTYMVEKQCAHVMQLLGYRATVVPASREQLSRSTSPQSTAMLNLSDQKSMQRYVERGRPRHTGHRQRLRGKNNATIEPRDEFNRLQPALLLRHLGDPEFVWCPIRLAGAEPIMRYFVRRDRPTATATPLCFPELSGERCPSRHGAKWHRGRWGSYPFEAVEADVGESGAAQDKRKEIYTFAFVRNPYDRLVSAYRRHIIAQDKGTAVHRAWIRELHGLGDRDPITFSHFVRWVAQQDERMMHRSWVPFSSTCQFDTKRYDFIGKIENLDHDVLQVLEKLKLSAADRSLWHSMSSKSAPAQAIAGEDRVQQLHHYYYADDEHDLAEIVRQIYGDDLRRFNYSFPAATKIGTTDAGVHR